MAAEQVNIPSFSTLVFLDLETTGLPSRYQAHRITELSLCAIERSHFLSNATTKKLPRVLNRLNLCINPTIRLHHDAATISQLSNNVLDDQFPFDSHAFDLMKIFIDRLKAPVCLVAHNGFGFDFPLLKAEIEKIGKVSCWNKDI